jgi:8-oxo-dGTP pyrophosphatase MutT (NUDIX family)
MGDVAALAFEDVVARVRAGLGELPGLAAQLVMAPQPRHGWKPGFAPDEARPAAALLLLYPVQGEATLLLTKRASHLPQHQGQVSLPGGAVDPGESIEDAALREAHEEVGLPPAIVEILGRLTPVHIPVSGYVLHPVIGTAAERPVTAAEAGEVERIIEVSVADLLDPERHRRVTRVRDGLEFDMPYFDIDHEEIWGATAMVLAEFAALLGAWRPGL